LSYHYGSVWPLFTGWSSVAAYRYGRPHVGYTALMSNALLTWPGALGYVTELLSGDYATAFGRSSHHQIWSEAMVVAPVLKGLLGIDADEAAGMLRFAPALPATWTHVEVKNVAMGAAEYDVSVDRNADATTVKISAHGPADAAHRHRAIVSPAFAADARVRSVRVNGSARTPEVRRIGDEQRIGVEFDLSSSAEIVFSGDQGTEVEAESAAPVPGESNQGLRLLRVRADEASLHLVAEGTAGRSYTVRVRSSRRLSAAAGVTLLTAAGAIQPVQLAFEGSAGYVRREFTVPLSRRLP